MFPGRRALVPVPLSRVELHAHLDGCVRHETIWELMKTKGMSLPGDGTFHALQQELVVRDPKDLAHFLRPFGIFSPAIQGDLSAVERVAWEFGLDKARRGVLYVEARFAPYTWLLEADKKLPTEDRLHKLEHIVEAVQRGFSRAHRELGIESRLILCVLNGLGNARDTLRLCERFTDKGVVGIDMAKFSDGKGDVEEVPLTPEELEVFHLAKEKSIHRTVHAGESGGADMVLRAVNDYGAERVGHGYHVLEDDAVYVLCRKRDIHFECCPWSSLLTGAVAPGVAKHPIARFAEDAVNFSLNTDDTTITGVTLQEDYDLASSWGLTEAHMVRANMNALRSSFLPEADKKRIKERLLESFGVQEAEGVAWGYVRGAHVRGPCLHLEHSLTRHRTRHPTLRVNCAFVSCGEAELKVTPSPAVPAPRFQRLGVNNGARNIISFCLIVKNVTFYIMLFQSYF